jgi:hypothetical protein
VDAALALGALDRAGVTSPCSVKRLVEISLPNTSPIRQLSLR